MFTGTRRAKRKVAQALGSAAEEFGFLYVEGHGIAHGTIDSVYQQAATWFRQPLQKKLAHYIGRSRNHRGYVPQSEQGLYPDEGARHYEAFDLGLDLPADDPDSQRAHYLMGPNVWPDQTGFRSTVGGYYDAVARVGQVMCEAFEIYLGLPKNTLTRAMAKPTSQLRLLHYLQNDGATPSTDINMGAHTDYECFTILHQARPGLQVLGTGGDWIEAPPLDGTFTVNIGDLLETWTNGRFKSTLHRVLNDGEERFSLPFFVAADYDAVIAPLSHLVPKGQRPAYQPIVAGHHLLGQLLRDFPYLRQRHARGLMPLPFSIPECNPFEFERVPLARAA
jgi:isopenicillin N synthase-like dioxygenase